MATRRRSPLLLGLLIFCSGEEEPRGGLNHVLSPAHVALNAERALQAEPGAMVVGNDYATAMSQNLHDGSGTVLMRQVSAKDLARAERAEAMAIEEADKLLRQELRGQHFWHPPRGAIKDYFRNAGDMSAPVGRMLYEAMRWSLRVRGARDPVYARDKLGMKGVKHWTEWLDLARLAVAAGDDEARKLALESVHETVPRVLNDSGYHAWLTFPTDSWRFRQDSMSYLRAYYLCTRIELGLGESHPELMADWRRRIVGILPRVWTHLSTRGIDQKLNFIKLFRAVNLYEDTGGQGTPATKALQVADEPRLLPSSADLDAFEAAVFDTTLIRRQVPLGWYILSPERPYDLSHEIFALTDDGRNPFPFKHTNNNAAPSPSSPSSRGLVEAKDARGDDLAQFYEYALRTVSTLLRLYARRDTLDIACEFVVNLGQLGVRVDRRRPPGVQPDDNTRKLEGLYLSAVDYIKSRRNADGSFGESHDQAYIKLAKKNGAYDTDLGGTLHTTYVCLWALTQPLYVDDVSTSWVTLNETLRDAVDGELDSFYACAQGDEESTDLSA